MINFSYFILTLLNLIFVVFCEDISVIITAKNKTKDHPFFGNGDRVAYFGGDIEGETFKVNARDSITFTNTLPCTELGGLFISFSPEGDEKKPEEKNFEKDRSADSAFVLNGVKTGSNCNPTVDDNCVCNGDNITFTPSRNQLGVVYYTSQNKLFAGGRIEVVEKNIVPIPLYITAQLRTPAHPNQAGEGGVTCPEGIHPIGYAVCTDPERTNCVEGQELNLLIGQPYEFFNDKCGHPFYISDNVIGKLQSNGADRIEGDNIVVKTPGQLVCGDNSLTYTPTANDIGKSLYYQCELHCRMGWKINVVEQSICGKYSNALGLSNKDLLDDIVGEILLGSVELTEGIFNIESLAKYFDGTGPFLNDATFINFVDLSNLQQFRELADDLTAFFGQSGILSCRDGTISKTPISVADLAPVHADMPINTEEFEAFNDQLIKVLNAFGVEDQDQNAVADILSSTKDLICNHPDCREGYVPSFCDKYTDALELDSNLDLMLTVVVAVFGNLVEPASPVADFFDGIYDCINEVGGNSCERLENGDRSCETGINTLPFGNPVSCIPKFDRAFNANEDVTGDDPLNGDTYNDDLFLLAVGLVSFFGGALGCTQADFPSYTGAPMGQIHQHMPIDVAAFNGFNKVFLDTLDGFGVTAEDLDPVAELLEAFKFDICTQPDCQETFCQFYSNDEVSQLDLLTLVVDNTVTVALGEAKLAVYFDGTKNGFDYTNTTNSEDLTFLKTQLVTFFGSVLGCNELDAFVPKGSLAELHEPLGINTEEFNLFNDALIQVMRDAGVGENDLAKVRITLDNTLTVICFDADCTGGAPGTDIPINIDVVAKTTAHPQFGEGFASGYTVDFAGAGAKEGAALFLESGKTYVFNYPGSCFHPFFISTDPTGADGGASVYETGVTGTKNNGDLFTCGGDTITFTPTGSEPDLWYQCTNHGKMGGRIFVDSQEEPQSICDFYTQVLEAAVVNNAGLITAVVADTVALAVSGPPLVKYFDGSGPGGDIDFTAGGDPFNDLAGSLISYFGGVLGCSDGSIPAYTGRTMKDAHTNMTIIESEFNGFNDALISVLDSYGVSRTDKETARKILDSTKSDICNCCGKQDTIPFSNCADVVIVEPTNISPNSTKIIFAQSGGSSIFLSLTLMIIIMYNIFN